jgi:hypothetical protein
MAEARQQTGLRCTPLPIPGVRGIDGEELHSDAATERRVQRTIYAGIAALTDHAFESVPPIEQVGTV